MPQRHKHPFDSFSRRQSVILPPLERLILIDIARFDGISLGGLLVRMIDDEIKIDPNYDKVKKVAIVILSICPDRKLKGQMPRQADFMPQPRMTGEPRTSRFSIALPLFLNEVAFLLARSYELSIAKLLLQFVQQQIEKHPRAAHARKLAEAQLLSWQKSAS